MADRETAQGQSGSKASGDSLSSLVDASVAGCWPDCFLFPVYPFSRSQRHVIMNCLCNVTILLAADWET